MADKMVYVVIFSKGKWFDPVLRVLWECKEDIARRICSDPRTSGEHFFLAWAYKDGRDAKPVPDDGRFDALLKELGLLKVPQDKGWYLLVPAKEVEHAPQD